MSSGPSTGSGRGFASASQSQIKGKSHLATCGTTLRIGPANPRVRLVQRQPLGERLLARRIHDVKNRAGKKFPQATMNNTRTSTQSQVRHIDEARAGMHALLALGPGLTASVSRNTQIVPKIVRRVSSGGRR